MELIVALDTQDDKKLQFLLKELSPYKPFYKVGMELFYTSPKIVSQLKAQNFKVFLDLKLHDIPNTVEKALTTLKQYSPDLINVHCLGGREMMERAAKVFVGTTTKLIGVTQLTSTEEKNLLELGISLSINESVIKLAILAKNCGLHGVVSSPLEVPLIKETCGRNFLTVTPGIRLNSDHQDQKRVTTPKAALDLGTDYIVVGRPITEATSPAQIYETILKGLIC